MAGEVSRQSQDPANKVDEEEEEEDRDRGLAVACKATARLI